MPNKWTFQKIQLSLNMVELIQNKLEDIIIICKKHNVISLSLFGSAANRTMGHDSDIDLLVQFSPTIDVLGYADNYFSLLGDLEVLLGRRIDLVSAKSLKNPVLKAEIDRSKIDLYAA